jgi:hypothetical protein
LNFRKPSIGPKWDYKSKAQNGGEQQQQHKKAGNMKGGGN